MQRVGGWVNWSEDFYENNSTIKKETRNRETKIITVSLIYLYVCCFEKRVYLNAKKNKRASMRVHKNHEALKLFVEALKLFVEALIVEALKLFIFAWY